MVKEGGENPRREGGLPGAWRVSVANLGGGVGAKLFFSGPKIPRSFCFVKIKGFGDLKGVLKHNRERGNRALVIVL